MAFTFKKKLVRLFFFRSFTRSLGYAASREQSEDGIRERLRGCCFVSAGEPLLPGEPLPPPAPLGVSRSLPALWAKRRVILGFERPLPAFPYRRHRLKQTVNQKLRHEQQRACQAVRQQVAGLVLLGFILPHTVAASL